MTDQKTAKPLPCSAMSIDGAKTRQPGQKIIIATPIAMPTELPGLGSVSEIRKKTAAIARPNNPNRKMVCQPLLIQTKILKGDTLRLLRYLLRFFLTSLPLYLVFSLPRHRRLCRFLVFRFRHALIIRCRLLQQFLSRLHLRTRGVLCSRRSDIRL